MGVCAKFSFTFHQKPHKSYFGSDLNSTRSIYPGGVLQELVCSFCMFYDLNVFFVTLVYVWIYLMCLDRHLLFFSIEFPSNNGPWNHQNWPMHFNVFLTSNESTRLQNHFSYEVNTSIALCVCLFFCPLIFMMTNNPIMITFAIDGMSFSIMLLILK